MEIAIVAGVVVIAFMFFSNGGQGTSCPSCNSGGPASSQMGVPIQMLAPSGSPAGYPPLPQSTMHFSNVRIRQDGPMKLYRLSNGGVNETAQSGINRPPNMIKRPVTFSQ